MKEKKPKIKHLVTMVTPIFNEEEILEKSIKKIYAELSKITENFEIIISDDGSTDATPQISSKLANNNDRIRFIRSEKNLGRGEALTRAFIQSKGEIIAFTDIDLAAEISELPMLIQTVKNGADVSTGSRWLPGSDVKRSPIRLTISYLYNLFVRLFFGSKLTDHQCGFKAFRSNVIFSVLKETGIRDDRGWAWDTEVLIRAQKCGYRVIEFPIRWRQGKRSKFNWNDIWKVGTYLIKLKGKMLKEKMLSVRKINSNEGAFKNLLEYRRWNEEMYEKYPTRLLYENKNPIVRFVENKRLASVIELSSIRENDAVIEIGCEEGYLLSCIPIGRIICGLDLSIGALKGAKEKVYSEPICFVLADAEHLPIRGEVFNRVIASEVLEHLRSPEKAIDEITRISKQEAIIVVSVPNEKTINKLRSILITLKLRRLFLGNEIPERTYKHLHYFDFNLLQDILKGKLEVIEKKLIPFNFFPIRIVIKCKKLSLAKYDVGMDRCSP